MALGATVYKVQLSVSDMDRTRYADHTLTVARHPSETDERMMVRILAFALYSSEHLAFGRGLSNVEEPDLIERDLTGNVTLWVEVGLPDERSVLKACGKAGDVVVMAYGTNVERWWQGVGPGLARARNLAAWRIVPAESQALAALATRTMAVQVTVQDGTVWFSVAAETVEVHPERLAR